MGCNKTNLFCHFCTFTLLTLSLIIPLFIYCLCYNKTVAFSCFFFFNSLSTRTKIHFAILSCQQIKQLAGNWIFFILVSENFLDAYTILPYIETVTILLLIKSHFHWAK